MTARTDGLDLKITGAEEVKAIKAGSSKIAGVVVVVKAGSSKIVGVVVVKTGSSKIVGVVVVKTGSSKIVGVVVVSIGGIEMIEETLSKGMIIPLHPRILRKHSRYVFDPNTTSEST